MAERSVRNLGRVAVLMGGRSAEREVSLMSGQGVLAALRSRGVDAHAFDPAERPMEDLKRDHFDRVFIALHGRHGEDGTVQGALELLGIPYTGSGVMASAIGIDKCMTKRIWLSHGLPTPQFRIARSPLQVSEAALELGLPMAVKPAREGSSLGFTRLEAPGQAAAAFEAAARHDGDVLCEQFISGRELTVALLGSGPQAQVLPVIEIVAPAGNYDYQNKYFTDETRYDCPARLPEALAQRIAGLALAAYQAVGCEGWGRVDLMLRDGDDAPFLLEVNTSPGMTGHSLVPMAARAVGLSYEDLCLRLIDAASLKTGGEP
ncbi:MAG: D-alanine--D-alanine ligase [Burkholderiaceae bacterium]